MKDRISLYPGRYEMNSVPGEPNKIDLVRADEPIQEGTPLTKKNLLTDETADALGLDGEDATVNDAFLALAGRGSLLFRSGTLSSTAWSGSASSGYTQTISVDGVLADETKQAIWATPRSSYRTAWKDALIEPTGQAENSLTFTAQTKPTSSITVYVFIMGVSG